VRGREKRMTSPKPVGNIGLAVTLVLSLTGELSSRQPARAPLLFPAKSVICSSLIFVWLEKRGLGRCDGFFLGCIGSWKSIRFVVYKSWVSAQVFSLFLFSLIPFFRFKNKLKTFSPSLL